MGDPKINSPVNDPGYCPYETDTPDIWADMTRNVPADPAGYASASTTSSKKGGTDNGQRK